MTINLSQFKNTRIYFFITLLTFVVYGNSINNEYAIDDNIVVEGNQLVAKGLKALPEIFTSRFATGKQEYEYRPTVLASFAIEKQFFSKLPESQTIKEKKRKDKLTQANISHFINVLLYALTCVLLFKLLTRIFDGYNILLPLITTLLFLVHPLHTEVVANIKSRDELFMLIGIIMALTWFIKFTELNQYKYLIFAFLAILFALYSKRNAIMIFGLAPVVLYFIKADYKKIGIVFFSMVLVFVISILIKKGLLTGKSTRNLLFFENPLFYQGTIIDRITVGLYCAWFYLEMLIFPINMSYYYGYNQIPMADFSYWQVWAAILFFVPLGIYGFVQFIKRNPLGLGILIWFGVMLGVINVFFPIVGIAADRYTYAFSIGFCIVLAYLIVHYFKLDISKNNIKVKLPSVMIVLMLIISVVYSGRTLARNSDWHDYITLYTTDIEHLTESAKAHALLANTLYPMIAKEAQKNPNNPEIQKEIQKIIYHYKEAIRIDSNYTTSINNLGSVYVNFLRDYSTAIKYCAMAVEQDPDYLEAHFNLAFSYQNSLNFEKAFYHYLKVIEINPDYNKVYELLNGLLQKYEKTNEGIQSLIELAAKSTKPKPIYISIANLYSLTANGNYTKSIEYFEKAYQLDYSDKVLCNHLAKLYQAMGNSQKANEFFNNCQ
ncbi:MAG: tetratricopeptide repeat protein [Flavobacteriales bacterium]|nr:tetratricopeptide repeat protein [Flavobacteriales bacterium]